MLRFARKALVTNSLLTKSTARFTVTNKDVKDAAPVIGDRPITHKLTTATSSPNFNYGFPTPGPQTPTPQKVVDHIFFVNQTEWKKIREEEHFDYIVIGSAFGALGFVDKALSLNPHTKILILERGPFFLPTHFQDLPVPYQKTLGGLSETFPWTLSEKTVNGKYIKWQHGQVPFFGGRSILWSAWCPTPTKEEMRDWPEETRKAAYKYMDEAKALLNVRDLETDNKVSEKTKEPCPCVAPVYGLLQEKLIGKLKQNLSKVKSATRVFKAPLAVDSPDDPTMDFVKFSTNGKMLKLITDQQIAHSKGESEELKVATECIVERILQQNGKATALQTSRGTVAIGDAKLILAMGSLPATTLVQNSFPQAENAGKRFTAHFITSVIARIPRKDYDFADDIKELEMSAIYLAGMDKNKGQYHIQLTAISDKNPEENAVTAARHMPDVVATATLQQLIDSKDYVVFVCAVLGEIHEHNEQNWFRKNNTSDPTSNSILQVVEGEHDSHTWDTMDEGTFQALEDVLSPKGKNNIEYWHPDATGATGEWVKTERPSLTQRRVPGLVHEGSTMHIGNDKDAVVDLDYRLKGVENVYVTGTSLWPTSGSWNPTMTMVAMARDLAVRLNDKKQSK